MYRTEHTRVHRRKKKKTGREGVRLQWVLQKEAASSRCHRWRKSTVTPSRASHPSVGEGIKRLARPHFSFALFSPVLTAVLRLRKKKTKTADWDILSAPAAREQNEFTALHCPAWRHHVSWWTHYTLTACLPVCTWNPKDVFLSNTSALLASSQSNFTFVHTSLTKHRWL